ncbi:SOD_CuZN13 [Ramazzottius varieornatus]|uniref:Superoxide dismutase [Cu-Zn] n=1 Tax=Ramazzottius varieornatus TaxID=947166 RepID=A0A1D1VE88_RAMVA|nr:SOD_CuZN13 [Ramazzottius varieornatus]
MLYLTILPTLLALVAYVFASPLVGDTPVTATVHLEPNDNFVTGTITLRQQNMAQGITFTGSIEGLKPGKHGFHFHEKGDTGNNCMNAGEHYNPSGKNHSDPHDPNRHFGDFGNIEADSWGVARVDGLIDPKNLVSLFNASNSVIGRTLVVHTLEDDLGKGDNAESTKTGNAGGRLACGIVGYDQK